MGFIHILIYAQCKLLNHTWTFTERVCACVKYFLSRCVATELALLELNKHVFVYQLSF